MRTIFSKSARALAAAASIAGLVFTSVSSADTPPPGHNPQACQSWASYQAAAVYTSVYNQVLSSCRQSGGSYCEGPAQTYATQAQAQAYNYYYNACMTS
ncbi:MAG TPA: hypothetical protein VIN58_23635 [Roseateles sp.]